MAEHKEISFRIPAKLHADLKARLFYDQLPMTKFIRIYIKEYLNKNSLILEFIDTIKEEAKIQNKKKRIKSSKLVEKGQRVETLFNLTGEEIEDIYDIVELEDVPNHEVR